MTPSTADAIAPKVLGRYDVFAPIAAGGMAVVHVGRIRGAYGFSRPVAIKRLHARLALDPALASILVDEAKITARIRHPNVVATLDVVAEGGELALVMEYVHGETLATLLAAAREKEIPCPPEVAAAVVHGVLLGLHAAHEATDASGTALEIIHRDVSPQNVLVTSDGVPRILDFGIAKASSRLSNTREGQVKGKVPYMAPEVLRLEPITRRIDVYAAAVLLWEALCGRQLFADAQAEGSLWALVLTMPVPAPSSVASVPSALDPIVMRGLSRLPDDRFATALEMARALEAVTRIATPHEVSTWVESLAADALEERAGLLRALETSPAPFLPAGAIAPKRAPAPDSPVAPAPAPRRAPRWLVAGATTVSLLLALAIVVLTRSPSRATVRASDGPGGTVNAASSPSDDAPPAPPEPASAGTAAEASPPAPVAVALPVGGSAMRTTAPDPRAHGRRPPPSGHVAPRALKKCDPPFTLDAEGNKHFKKECFQTAP